MGKNKLTYIGILVLAISFLNGCDSRVNSNGASNPSQQQPSASSQQRLVAPQVMPGYTYKFIIDGSCKAGDNEVCISAEDYEAFCVYSQGMSKSVTNRLAMANDVAFKLYEGGFVESTNVSWNPAGTIYKCRAKLVVQGNYQGSSRREIVDGAAMFFKNTGDGDLIVTYADPNSP